MCSRRPVEWSDTCVVSTDSQSVNSSLGRRDLGTAENHCAFLRNRETQNSKFTHSQQFPGLRTNEIILLPKKNYKPTSVLKMSPEAVYWDLLCVCVVYIGCTCAVCCVCAMRMSTRACACLRARVRVYVCMCTRACACACVGWRKSIKMRKEQNIAVKILASARASVRTPDFLGMSGRCAHAAKIPDTCPCVLRYVAHRTQNNFIPQLWSALYFSIMYNTMSPLPGASIYTVSVSQPMPRLSYF